MIQRSILCFLLAVLAQISIAQIDKQFWFAVPEVTEDHGDDPIVLRFSTFDQPATITVSFPANLNLGALTTTVAANSSTTVDLSLYKDQIENQEPNKVLNRGVLIEATSNITAYYEVNAGNNPDIFALKGRNALGTKFYTPFQNTLFNQDVPSKISGATVRAYSSFDIVATENNTTVTITPSVAIVGHAQGVPFSIVLNKGETYSARAIDEKAASHPAGSKVVSDKPIAITIKDDSVVDGEGQVQYPAWDLIGDQLVPTNIIGDEYGLTFGRGYVLATEDNTQISVNGSVVKTLNEGETHLITVTKPSLITGTSPFYLLQVGGIGFEIGGAILPPLKCTGSKQIAITQSVEDNFILMVVVQDGGENSFVLNGNTTAIKGSEFKAIGNGWKAAEIDLSNVFLFEENIKIENTSHFFHLGIRNGTSVGARFGYFSDFGFLDLGIDLNKCQGDEIVLDAGPNHSTYKWSTGETTERISVDQSGEYWVEVSRGSDCPTVRDTVEVEISAAIVLTDFGPDKQICKGDSVVLLPGGAYPTYEWSTGSKDTILVVTATGEYSVKVSNEGGCSASESIKIEVLTIPEITLGEDTVVCRDLPLVLSVIKNNNQITWNTGATDSSIAVQKEGFYAVRAENMCGVDTASKYVEFWKVEIPNIITPNGDFKNDYFFIKGIDYGNWNLIVQNRWGGLVYQNEYYQNSFGAEELSDGVYYYILKQEDVCNSFKGWLQIIR